MDRCLPRSVDSRIAHAATPGFPVVTRRRLRAAGVHRARIASRVADGRLTHAWGETFLVGPHDLHALPRDLLRRAAVASVEPYAMLGGVSAIERHTDWRRFSDVIHVVSDRWHMDIPDHGIRFRRTERRPGSDDEIVLVRGVPTASPLLAMLQAARDLSPYQAANAIKELEFQTSLRAEDVVAAADEAARVLGAPVLRRAAELVRSGSAGTKSRTEDRLLSQLHTRYGEPLVNVRGSTGILDYEPDMLWWSMRCILEVDGHHHVEDPAVRNTDLERDALLRADGWLVLRIPWRRVWNDLPQVLCEIDTAFRPRLARISR